MVDCFEKLDKRIPQRTQENLAAHWDPSATVMSGPGPRMIFGPLQTFGVPFFAPKSLLCLFFAFFCAFFALDRILWLSFPPYFYVHTDDGFGPGERLSRSPERSVIFCWVKKRS